MVAKRDRLLCFPKLLMPAKDFFCLNDLHVNQVLVDLDNIDPILRGKEGHGLKPVGEGVIVFVDDPVHHGGCGTWGILRT